MSDDQKTNELRSFKNPDELIRVFNKWKEYLNVIYENRNIVGYTVQNLKSNFPNISDSIIENMKNYDVISVDFCNKTITLNQSVVKFFEELCDNYGTVNTGVLDQTYQMLKESLDRANINIIEENSSGIHEELSGVIHNLRYARALLPKSFKSCSFMIDEQVIKSNKSFSIKKYAIETIRERLNDIDRFIKNMVSLINDRHNKTMTYLKNMPKYGTDVDSAYTFFMNESSDAPLQLGKLLNDLATYNNTFVEEDEFNKNLRILFDAVVQNEFNALPSVEQYLPNISENYSNTFEKLKNNFSVQNFLLQDVSSEDFFTIYSEYENSVQAALSRPQKLEIAPPIESKPMPEKYLTPRDYQSLLKSFSNQEDIFDLFEFINIYYENKLTFNEQLLIFVNLTTVYGDKLYYTEQLKRHQDRYIHIIRKNING